VVIFSIIARLRAKIQHARRLTLRAVVRTIGETTGKSEWIKKAKEIETMTIEERAELAVETFAAGKGNCTQSVLCAWEDKIPVDHDTLMKLGAGYGAGMGCMQATCGALIGAVMAAGSVTDGKGTPRTARSILTSFTRKRAARRSDERTVKRGVGRPVRTVPLRSLADVSRRST